MARNPRFPRLRTGPPPLATTTPPTFLRLSIIAALTNKNADIISTKEGLCDEWQQVPSLKQHGGKGIEGGCFWCYGQNMWIFSIMAGGLKDLANEPLSPLFTSFLVVTICYHFILGCSPRRTETTPVYSLVSCV